MRERRLIRTIVWISLGLLMGVILGLLLGWVAWPAEFAEADPTVLEESYQRDFTLMIATAYDGDKDLLKAQRLLKRLGKGDGRDWLLAVTVDHILAGGEEAEARRLVGLATDLGLNSPIMSPYLTNQEEDFQ